MKSLFLDVCGHGDWANWCPACGAAEYEEHAEAAGWSEECAEKNDRADGHDAENAA